MSLERKRGVGGREKRGKGGGKIFLKLKTYIGEWREGCRQKQPRECLADLGTSPLLSP